MKEDVQTANKHMKRHSTLLFRRKCKLKLLKPTGMAKIKMTDTPSVDEVVEHLELICSWQE